MNFKLVSVLLVNCLIGIPLLAQKETNIWHFKAKLSLDFSSGSPIVDYSSAIEPYAWSEGCASICDPDSGNTLFYTDGATIWNANNDTMLNGSGLAGLPSATQSCIIVPFPRDPEKYYVFTMDASEGDFIDGLMYSIVDMSLDTGLGAVTTKNTQLEGYMLEKITAVHHCNGEDIWVIVHKYGSNEFQAYLVTSTGIQAPVSSFVGSTYENCYCGGYMRTSPDGKRLAIATHDYDNIKIAEVLDFDNFTGKLSNPITLNDLRHPYGLEFSPDNQLLYIQNTENQDYGYLYQYNLLAGNATAINASRIVIDSTLYESYDALQLGPDLKIYRINDNYIDIIHNPNQIGSACNYDYHAISLYLVDSNGYHIGGYGLPNFITSFFDSTFSHSYRCDTVNPIDTTKSSIANNIDHEFKIFPNPVSNEFKISHPNHERNISIEIIDMHGRSCGHAVYLESEIYSISHLGLAKGAYILCVRKNADLINRSLLQVE